MSEPAASLSSQENRSQQPLDFKEAVATAREDMLARVLASGKVAALISCLVSSLAFIQEGFLFYGIFTIGLFFIDAGKRSFRQKATALLALFYAAAIVSLFTFGFGGSWLLFLAAFSVMTAQLFGPPTTLKAGLVVLGTWLTITLANLAGFLILPAPSYPLAFADWMFAGLTALLVIVALTQSPNQLYEAQGFISLVSQQKRELQETRIQLTQRTQQLDFERHLLHTLLDTVSDKIFFKDLAGRYTRVSKALARQFGVRRREVIGKTDFDFYAKEYARQIQVEEAEILQSGIPIVDKVEREIWPVGKPNTWSLTTRLPLRDENGHVLGWVGTSRNITEIALAQEAAERYAMQLSTAAEVSRAVTSTLDLDTLLDKLVDLLKQSFDFHGVAAWLLSEDGQELHLQAASGKQGDASKLYKASTGGSEAGMQAVAYPNEARRHPLLSVPANSKNVLVDALNSGHYHLFEILNDDGDRQEGYRPNPLFPGASSALILPLKMRHDALGVLEILSDKQGAFQVEGIPLLKSLADQVAIAISNALLFEQVHQLASTDALTGLYNRHRFFELGEREVERALRYSLPLSAMMLDIDHYKKVNDAFGHAVGDQVLSAVARMLNRHLREIDLISRYGGDEFAVLLPDTDLAYAARAAERVRLQVEGMEIMTDAGLVHVTMSCGLCNLDHKRVSLRSLLEVADRALYTAKQAGRNRVVTIKGD